MAFTGSSDVEYKDKESRVEKYTEADNVKNIQKELSKLKKEVSGSTTTQEVSATEEITFGTEKETWDKFAQDMDYTVENIFDDYIKTNESHIKTLLKKWQTGQDELATEFDTNIRAKALVGFDTYKNILTQETIQQFKFELFDLNQNIITMINEEDKVSSSSWSGNVLLNDMDEGEGEEENKEEKEKGIDEYYTAPYKTWEYADVSKETDIANIYNDKKLPKYMEDVFDAEEKEELRRWKFRINLGKENGLAGIIIAIREALASGNSETSDTGSDSYKLYEELYAKWILTSQEPIKINISKKQLKELIDGKFLTYEDTKTLWLNEKGKVAKILSNASWSDLDTFASLLQSKSNETMAVKEWHNAKEMVNNNLITSDNVLEFLCDFNGDGQISAEYKKKNNKEQKKQGDVGTLFGQQVMWTIEQAIATQNVELGDPQGEQVVIGNIVKNMQVSDSRILDEIQKQHLLTMQSDPTECTKENLALLLNGDTDKGVVAMPEMKIFFLDAIKKINGWSTEVNPDLADTLTGKDVESIIDIISKEAKLGEALDKALEESTDPDIIEAIKSQWLVRVRQTCFTKIMSWLDNLEITVANKPQTSLQASWVTKWWETRELKKTLLEKITTTLLKSWIHFIKWELQLSIWYGKEWYLWENQKTKYARWVWTWVWWNRRPWGTVGIFVDLTGEIAEQYNFKQVINADLSQVKSAKYLGIELWARASIDLKNIKWWIDIWAETGINRQKDPVVGINQIDKQYTNISAEIFTIEKFSADIMTSKETFTSYLYKRIEDYKIDKDYWAFVTTNEQHLKDSADFMARYMETNKLFGADSILIKKSTTDQKLAINALLDIIQSWVHEQRRHDVIAWLHGKISLTKLSFWVTTSILTAKSGKNTGGETKLGICGFYIGARISTWKNSYVPNVAQYLFTEYEIGQGVNTEYIDNPTQDLDKYAKYLEALYNDQKRLSCEKDETGRLVITFTKLASDPEDLTLQKFLNIHATTAADKNFSLKDNILTIGSVGDIWAYTITEAKGVRRILCLWTKKLDEATHVTEDNATTTVGKMEFIAKGNKEWTQEKLKTDIFDKMTSTVRSTPEKLLVVQKETAAFFTEGKIIKPTGAEWADKNFVFNPTTLPWTALKNWTLTITKSTDGKSYAIKLDTSFPTDSVKIDYIDQKEYNDALIAANKIETNRETTEVATTAIETAFNMPTNISSVFIANTEKALSVFDDYNNTLYKEFMESAVSTWLDSFIDATDYTTTFTALKAILAKNAKYDELTDLKALIEKTDLTANERMLIVDKFKTIFSYLIYLSNGKLDGADLADLINNHRWTRYKRIEWPDGSAYPLTMDYRKTILKNLKWETTLKREPVENLIGFTAFYKLNGEWRKYAMTPVGGTNVLTGSSLEESMMTLDAADTIKAQEWFIKNLDVNADNKKLILKKINLLLKENNVTITEANLSTLLKWNELIVDFSKKIRIDLNRIFYLLGECGNESFWVKINKIYIKEIKNDIPVAGMYTATWVSEKEYENGIATKSHSITSKVLTKELKLWVKARRWIPKDHENDDQNVEDEEDDQEVEDEEDDQSWDDENDDQSWDDTGWKHKKLK